MDISKKTANITPSVTLSISATAKKLKSEGKDVISFSVGEPDFNTPKFICDAAIAAMNEGKTGYTAAAGLDELKTAVKDKFKNDNNLDYELSQIIISNGAKHSLNNALLAVTDPGDEVIIPAPYWVSYEELVKIADGVPVIARSKEENDFKVTPEDIKKVISPKTKAILLNSPSNPTGMLYNESELRAIGELAVENNIIIISDEIYEYLVYDGEKHYSIAQLDKRFYDQTIVINGVSKGFAMTGWRIGFAAGPKKVIKAMSSLQSHATSNPNTIAQHATIAALNGPKGEIETMVKEFDKRRLFMKENLEKIPGLKVRIPKGAFYFFVNISELKGKKSNEEKINNSVEFCQKLLDDHFVASVPGSAFGMDDYVRLSYSASIKDIEEGIKRIKTFVENLS